MSTLRSAFAIRAAVVSLGRAGAGQEVPVAAFAPSPSGYSAERASGNADGASAFLQLRPPREGRSRLPGGVGSSNFGCFMTRTLVRCAPNIPVLGRRTWER